MAASVLDWLVGVESGGRSGSSSPRSDPKETSEMPRELIATAPRTPILREYEDPPLGPNQIRIRTEFASPKHGTELVAYRGDAVTRRPYDPVWGATIQRPPSDQPVGFPRPLGNMAVGVVAEVGSDVSRYRVGDRVFGHFPIRETQTVDETHADPLPAGLSPEAAVCLDPVVMALALRDANPKLGDHVAVFGLGAIGLIAVQLAHLAGAERVIAVDPIPARRELALACGADLVLDPREDDGDVGLAIRRQTGFPDRATSRPPERVRIVGGYWEEMSQRSQRGVDVAVECSGSTAALQQAIRATRFGGTVCVISYYGGEATGLRLGEEFHVNRLTLVSARSQSLPLRDAPAWTLERLSELALSWLVSGRIQTDAIVTPVVSFLEVAEAYREIDEHPERSIKLGIQF
jgi:threonine dehydrogenase-like Zn-dependent dehydrogenase